MRIPIRASGRTFFLWFGALFVAVGVALVYGGTADARRERAYRVSGQLVEAVVVDKSIQRASRDGNTRTRYEIRYRFASADGQTIQGSDAVDVERWERLAPGSPLTVAFLPSAPDTSRVAGSGDVVSPYIMIGMGTLLAAIGAVLLGSTAARLLRERRLIRTGAPAVGTVVAVERTAVFVNKVQLWAVRYRYLDAFGRPHEGKSEALPPDEAHSVNVGQEIAVRFDRSRPSVSVWVRTPPT
jgi:hypothetical protein